MVVVVGGERERESPARIPRMVGADGEDSWALGWGWNVAGHCLSWDQGCWSSSEAQKDVKKRRF